jgi:hypothetical protein
VRILSWRYIRDFTYKHSFIFVAYQTAVNSYNLVTINFFAHQSVSLVECARDRSSLLHTASVGAAGLQAEEFTIRDVGQKPYFFSITQLGLPHGMVARFQGQA